MKTVKAKQTIAGGSYGRLTKGETAVLKDKEANDLVKADLVDIVEDGGDDAEDSVKEKSSVTITDNTGKREKQEIVEKVEKKSDAGPNASKDDKADKKK